MELKRKNRQQEAHEHNVLVLGVGGAGINVLQRMDCPWDEHLRACAIDTDHQSIAGCREHDLPVMHLETRSTQGMSTAGDVDTGRHAVYENREKLATICSKADLVFIIAGFGGGTGTGAATVLAEIAADTGALVLGFIVMPFQFEGLEREIKARDGLTALQDIVDGVVLYQNDRLLDTVTDQTSLTAAFEGIGDRVARNVASIWRLITCPGLINLDFADIRRMVMDSHGICTLVSEEREGEQRCTALVEAVLDHPLFDCRRVLKESRAVIVGIRGGKDMTLREVEQIMNGLKEVTGEHTRLVMGTSIEDGWQGKTGLTLLASERFETGNGKTGNRQTEEATTEAVVKKTETGGKRRRKTKAVQSRLNLDMPGKGRFKDVEPTLRNGEDLDVPAFIRRGIQLSSEKQ